MQFDDYNTVFTEQKTVDKINDRNFEVVAEIKSSNSGGENVTTADFAWP